MKEIVDNSLQHSKDDVNDKEKDEKKRYDYSYNYSFGVNGYRDATGMNIPYDGEPIKMSYTIDNGDYEFVGAILIFIGGELQEYTIVETKEKGIKVPVDFSAHTETTVEFAFEPSYGNRGEVLPITFGFVLESECRPDCEYFDFGHAYGMSPFANGFGNLHMNCNSKENKTICKVDTFKTVMPQEDIDRYVFTSSNGEVINRLKNNRIELLVNGEKYNETIHMGDGRVTFGVRAFGGETIEYAVTMLLNGTPLLTDVIHITADGRNYDTAHVDIDFNKLDKDEYSIEEYNTLYVVACPVTYGKYEMPSKVIVANVSK